MNSDGFLSLENDEESAEPKIEDNSANHTGLMHKPENRVKAEIPERILLQKDYMVTESFQSEWNNFYKEVKIGDKQTNWDLGVENRQILQKIVHEI